MVMIENAEKYDIKVHFVDPRGQMANELREGLHEAIRIYEKETGLKYEGAASKIDMLKFWSKDQAHIDEFRSLTKLTKTPHKDTDLRLYEEIVDASDDQKTAVIFGSGHDHVIKNIIENADSDQNPVLVIDIWGNEDQFHAVGQGNSPVNVYEGEPDIVHILSTGKTYTTEKTPKDIIEGLKLQPSGGPSMQNNAPEAHSYNPDSTLRTAQANI